MTMWAKRVDANQKAIVYALRRAGAEVEPIHWAGRGLPDLLVRFPKGSMFVRLAEVKDGEKSPSARKLTPAEEAFAARFPVHIIETTEEALRLIERWRNERQETKL